MTGFKTIATVTVSGDLNGKSPPEAADATRAKLERDIDEWKRFGYEQSSNIMLVYKATGIGMRWIASVKMTREN